MSEPGLKAAFSELSDKQTKLKKLSVFFVITYAMRGVMFGLLGHYDAFIPSYFWKFELYFIVSTALEAPFVIYLYATHYRSFKSAAVTSPLKDFTDNLKPSESIPTTKSSGL